MPAGATDRYPWFALIGSSAGLTGGGTGPPSTYASSTCGHTETRSATALASTPRGIVIAKYEASLGVSPAAPARRSRSSSSVEFRAEKKGLSATPANLERSSSHGWLYAAACSASAAPEGVTRTLGANFTTIRAAVGRLLETAEPLSAKMPTITSAAGGNAFNMSKHALATVVASHRS